MDEAQNATTAEPEQSYFYTLRIAIEAFLANQWKLIKMEATEKSARFFTLLMIAVGGICFLFFVIFALSMLIGYAFASWAGSTAIGFAALSGLYLALLLLIWGGRKLWTKKLANMVVKIFFNKQVKDGDAK